MSCYPVYKGKKYTTVQEVLDAMKADTPISTPSNAKEAAVGDVVLYNNKEYIFRDISSSGQAQLVPLEGGTFSGTPNTDKLTFVRSMIKIEFNNGNYVLAPGMRIISLTTGKEVFQEGTSQREQLLNKFKNENLLQAKAAQSTLKFDNAAGLISKSSSNKTSDINFSESTTSGYSDRTKQNASADATIAIAVDFSSAGEKLTKSSVISQKKQYIPIDANKLEITPERVNKIVEMLNSTMIKGIQISTRSTDILGKKLTNPNWYAKELMDVETPYKANASKIKAPNLNAEEALKYDMNLMYKLQVQKFQKNPELIDEINARGGLEFIKQSSHIVGVKNSRWEGEGMDSNFIKVLSESYTYTAKSLGKFKEGNTSKDISLNIAGNGIYTMKGKYTQQQVDDFTYNLLKAVIESPDLKVRIASIRTGGQTGFDEAGAKAGIRLGIPTSVHAPKGWKFRNKLGQDISNEQLFKARFSTAQTSNTSSKTINDIKNNLDLYQPILDELGITSLDNLTPEQFNEILKKICR